MGRSEEETTRARLKKEGVSVVWGPRLAGAKTLRGCSLNSCAGAGETLERTRRRAGARRGERTPSTAGPRARVAASDSSPRARREIARDERGREADAASIARVAPRADSRSGRGGAPSPCTAVRGATGVFFSRAIVALAAHLRVLARDLRAVGEGGDERRGCGGGRRGRVRQDEPGHGLIHGRHRGAGALAEDRAHHRGLLRGRGQRGKRHPGVRRGGDPARRRAERVGESHDGRREVVPRGPSAVGF